MFYNYLIFNMVTLSLRILLKYCVSHGVFKCFICLILGALYTFSLVEKTIFVGRKVDKTAIGNMIKN